MFPYYMENSWKPSDMSPYYMALVRKQRAMRTTQRWRATHATPTLSRDALVKDKPWTHRCNIATPGSASRWWYYNFYRNSFMDFSCLSLVSWPTLYKLCLSVTYSCLLHDKFVIPCLFHAIRKISHSACGLMWYISVLREQTGDN